MLLSFVLCVAVRSGETGKDAVTRVQSLPLLSFHRLICAFTLFHQSQKPPEASVKTGRREWDIFRFLFFTISTSLWWCNTPKCTQKRGDETQSLSLCTKPSQANCPTGILKYIWNQLWYSFRSCMTGCFLRRRIVRWPPLSGFALPRLQGSVLQPKWSQICSSFFWECARLNFNTVITSQTQSTPPYLHFPWQCFHQLCARAVHGDVCAKMKRSMADLFYLTEGGERRRVYRKSHERLCLAFLFSMRALHSCCGRHPISPQ